jgi:hypothetical protein
MNISFTFCWVALDQDEKKELLEGLDELITFPMPPFERIDSIFSQIDCEFVLYLDKGGVPALRLSDRTRLSIARLISPDKN